MRQLRRGIWASSGGGGLLLDRFTGSAAAYSLRLLSLSITNVIRVRRSSDNTEQDFTPDEITDGTLTTFTGASNGLIVTWYDQSGNGFHATQSTASFQPTIVASGTLITDGGLPAIDFNTAANQRLITATGVGLTTKETSHFWVANQDTSGSRFFHSVGPSSFGTGEIRGFTGEYYMRFQGVTQDYNSYAETGVQRIHSALANTGASTIDDYDWYRNGSLLTPDSLSGGTLANIAASPRVVIGYNPNQTGANAFDGKQQELIIWSGDKHNIRTSIESNMNSYYTVY